MKRTIFLVAVVFSVFACKPSNTTNEGETVYTVPQLLESAMDMIDTADVVVKLTGTVEHVCSHSGRRCFLIDTIADESIKVEAGGEIESFGKELLGKEIVVTGLLKEQQLMASEIDEWEVELVEEHADVENGGEKCASEMANIKSMREWMLKNGKDYYAIYYIDGLSYEVVE